VRAQKQAVIHLIRYAESGLEEDLAGYRAQMQVVHGDREARLALTAPDGDPEVARRGLLAGGNHPEDVERMVVAFPLFRRDADVQRALRAWAAADALLAEVDTLAAALHEEVRARGADTWRAQVYARSAVEIDMRLTPLAEAYARALGTAARRLNVAIAFAGGVLALALVGWAVLMTRRTLRQLQGAEAQQREAERRLAELAQYDALTGLANRTLFNDRLAQAIARAHRTEQPVALLFVDLDRFKEINDSLGHEAGDAVLRETAARLRAHLREGDSVARLGGDEFTVILEDVAGPDEVRAVAQKLMRAFAEPIVVDGQDLFPTLSIGVALYPRDGDTAEALLRHADTAMYQAKAEGRDGFQFYAPTMSAAVTERVTLEGRLRQALERGEFQLHYQPVVRLQTGEVASLEALLRWRHPEDGLIAPGRFIAVAEQTGLIVPIGAWVLRNALATLAAWRSGGADAPAYVSVNVSARQFRAPGFVEQVRDELADSGLPAEALLLEITESLLLRDDDQVWTDLAALRALGVRIAIDDFGTGYSSLSYLRQVPIDVLKIDRSFIQSMAGSPQQTALVDGIIRLAHTLGLQVVAEGIEDAAERDLLIGMGCTLGQGYLFARPMPAEQAARWLAGGRVPV
jgi:diguanylate cyclase (GGDEF)-like protein